MGRAAVDRGGQLKRAALALLALLALLAVACEPPLADEPKAAFFLNFEGPPPLPPDFKGGSVPGPGHDVWFCFHAPELKLRDADRWQSADPTEEIDGFQELCPDPALEDTDNLEALRANERGAASEYARVLLRNRATNAYFVRTLRLRDKPRAKRE